MNNQFIAHQRSVDEATQSVCNHLKETSTICAKFTKKIALQETGELLGLLHDLGKYSSQFQNYIKSATGILNPDIDNEYLDAAAMKGKIDHSTAGAQWIWERFNKHGSQGRLVGQILSVCLASHHGGLLDCLRPSGEDGFIKRITKLDSKTHLQECLKRSDEAIHKRIELLATDEFLRKFCDKLLEIIAIDTTKSETIRHFKIGFLTRFLFSCLIDADRVNSADFETPENTNLRPTTPINWNIAIDRFETKISNFPVRNPIDIIRNNISQQCRNRAEAPQGIYTLTVPTGGGKTFSSMRYALHHAQKYNLDHIFYIIPFTSIIEQNAAEIRKVLEKDSDDAPWVLEHHSNLEPEQQSWRSKLVTENWDAPIIFTTIVQLLEVLFGGGTRGARRMHNLANSVVIFDEIQSLPVNCVHLFCNAIQFLVDHAKTTAVLCTATQPLLNNLKYPEKGQLKVPRENEMIENMTDVFNHLKRVKIENNVRTGGWTRSAITHLAIDQLNDKGNCLVIVNTKKWAQLLFELCADKIDRHSLFHLSTSLCPAHRKKVLAAVCKRLDNKLPVLCISTQLIEAGVDIDFNSVIRFLAGLDSIAQAAGRCNRNGKLTTGHVFVINPQEERIDNLPDIKIGRDKSLQILSEEKETDLLNPSIMKRYFSYYFHERADLMVYPLTEKQAGRKDSLLNLLSENVKNTGRTANRIALQQSFQTAGKSFKAIDAPSQAVIVPYQKGRDIIARLCAEFEPAKSYELLKQAQQYSVNVFPNVWEKLKKAAAVRPIQDSAEIYYLDERYYSTHFGLSTDEVNTMDTLIG